MVYNKLYSLLGEKIAVQIKTNQNLQNCATPLIQAAPVILSVSFATAELSLPPCPTCSSSSLCELTSHTLAKVRLLCQLMIAEKVPQRRNGSKFRKRQFVHFVPRQSFRPKIVHMRKVVASKLVCGGGWRVGGLLLEE